MSVLLVFRAKGACGTTNAWRAQVMRVLGVPLPFYKSPTLLLGWGVSPFVFWQLLKARPDVIHAAFPGASAGCKSGERHKRRPGDAAHVRSAVHTSVKGPQLSARHGFSRMFWSR